MLRPLLHHEAPWSWRSLRPISRGGRRSEWPASLSHRTRLPIVAVKSCMVPVRRLSSVRSQKIRSQNYSVSTSVAREDASTSTVSVQDKLPSGRDLLRRELLAAMRSRNPERLLAAALEAFRDDELVGSLPPTTIAQIFDLLRFDELLAQHKAIAQLLAPGAVRAAQAAGWKVHNIRQTIERIGAQFSALLQEWLGNGHPIDLSIYKSHLRFLSSAGDAKGARQLRALCEDYGIQWDVEAYNLFLEALCWEGAYLPDEFGKLRVLDEAMSYKKKNESQNASAGYSTAIKTEAMDAFEEMMSQGYSADARTFSLLMLSMGRIGDLEGVEATLNRIWGINVSSVIHGDASGVYFENDMQPDTPLYPDGHLLFVVAHIYGSNNALATALKVVDFIAQKYSLKISTRTWEELAKWAFILGTRRGGGVTSSPRKGALQRSLAKGQVPRATFRSIWKTMLSSRFRITPSLQMHNHLFATHYRRGEILDMANLLRKAQKRLNLGRSRGKLQIGSGFPADKSPQKSSTELERLNALADSTVFLRWVRLLMDARNMESRTTNLSLRWYHTFFMPNLIAEWGNDWFHHTSYTMHFRSIWGNRLSFHRHMQDENRTVVEVFSSTQKDRYIVRAKAPCFHLPFQEVTHAERRQHRMERGIAHGQDLRYDAPIQWYESSKMKDWIWLASGKGVLVKGGRFQGSKFEDIQDRRKLVLPPHSLDHLTQDQSSAILQKLESQ